MNDTIKAAVISAFITAIFATVTSMLIFFLGNFSTEEKNVEILSEYFNSVDKDMSYKQALQTIYEESEQNEKEIEKLYQQNADYQNELANRTKFESKSPSVVSGGVKIQENVNNAVLVDEDNTYYSEKLLRLVLESAFSYDVDQNTVFYNTNGEKEPVESKIELNNTDVLYDGDGYEEFLPQNGKTFSMGSGNYNKGFVIFDDFSLFGAGDGYALFDLQGKYSKISFNVGRTNDYEKEDVVLKVYLNDEYVEEYPLNAQSPPVPLEIDLNYASNMKIEITGGNRVIYGFANIFLYY